MARRAGEKKRARCCLQTSPWRFHPPFWLAGPPTKSIPVTTAAPTVWQLVLLKTHPACTVPGGQLRIFSLALVPGTLALSRVLRSPGRLSLSVGMPLDTPRRAFQEMATKKVGENTSIRGVCGRKKMEYKDRTKKCPFIGVNRKTTESSLTGDMSWQRGSMSPWLGLRGRRQHAAKTWQVIQFGHQAPHIKPDAPSSKEVQGLNSLSWQREGWSQDQRL